MEIQYNRTCPQCNKIINYKRKRSYEKACASQSICRTCIMQNLGKSKKGISQREIYGNNYKDIIKKRSDSLKKVKHTWHQKIADNRKLNGTYKISEKTRQKLKDTSTFRHTGENHIKIKKILTDRNITYEEYLATLSEYRKYYKKVSYISNRQPLHTLENFEKRGINGKLGAYQLDHIIEVSEGFLNNIEPNVIGDISNLQFIPWEENNKKRKYPNGMGNIRKETNK
jgi:hypothetical protein